MFNILRQRNFSLLWFGQLISTIGDWVLFVALPFFIYSLTGSTLATGAMFMAATLPRLLFGSVAGVFVDRWGRKKTMIVADILRGALLLLMLLVRAREQLWLIYLSAFAMAVVGQFFGPAKSAIIPRLVNRQDLLSANSLNALSDALTRLVGAGLGGALMGSFGFQNVIWLDAGSFFFSALMIALITVPLVEAAKPAAVRKPAATNSVGDQCMAVWREWMAGLQLVRRQRVLAALFAVLGVAMLGDSMITVLIVPLVKTLLGGGAVQLGWLMTAQGIGGIAGGVLAGQLGKVVPPRRLITLGLSATALTVLALLSLPFLPVTLAFMAIIGVVGMSWMVSALTLLQASVGDQYRGRVFGTYSAVSALTSLIGMGLSGTLGDLLGVVFMASLGGALYLAAGVTAWVTLRPCDKVQQSGPARAAKGLPARTEAA
jgi:MFS family permease